MSGLSQRHLRSQGSLLSAKIFSGDPTVFRTTDTPSPPCDTCEHAQRCRDEELVCEIYIFYADACNPKVRGKLRRGYVPSRCPCKELYRRFFK